MTAFDLGSFLAGIGLGMVLFTILGALLRSGE